MNERFGITLKEVPREREMNRHITSENQTTTGIH